MTLATEQVRSRLATGTADGCGRGSAVSVGNGAATVGPPPAATPANTADVPSSRNTTAIAEMSHAVGCLRMIAEMRPGAFGSGVRRDRLDSACVGTESFESVTR